MDSNEYSSFLHSLEPLINSLTQARQSLGPIIDLQNQISQTLKPIYSILERYRDVSKVMSENFLSIIKTQQTILNSLTIKNLNLPIAKISTDSSIAFTEISSIAINAFNYDVLPKELSEAKETALEISKSKKALTWEQVITIILFILTLASFIQDQMPDKMKIEISNSTKKLIEIQEKELKLLN